MALATKRVLGIALPAVLALTIGFAVGKWQGFRMGWAALEAETQGLLSIHVEAASCVRVGDTARALKLLDGTIDAAVLSLSSQPFALSSTDSLSQARLYRQVVPPLGPEGPSVMKALQGAPAMIPSPDGTSGLMRLARRPVQ